MMADTESIDNGSKISRLEQQYIKLLEFKIATLTASSTLGSQEQVQSSVNGIEPEVRALFRIFSFEFECEQKFSGVQTNQP